jgi:glutathione peroxidase
MTDSLLDITVLTADGAETTLREHAGKVLLIVNVASRCGLSSQYADLEALQQKYGPRGFVVLGFPSNQFFQELSSNDAIAEYCATKWGITFPIFDQVKVNGKSRSPLYAELTKAKDERGSAGNIRWNFEKFVVTPDLRVMRFRPTTVPTDPAIIDAIESNLPN